MEAWRLGGSEARRLGDSEAWRLGGLEAWIAVTATLEVARCEVLVGCARHSERSVDYVEPMALFPSGVQCPTTTQNTYDFVGPSHTYI